jgi:hypothetical protein
MPMTTVMPAPVRKAAATPSVAAVRCWPGEAPGASGATNSSGMVSGGSATLTTVC